MTFKSLEELFQLKNIKKEKINKTWLLYESFQL